MNEMFSQYGSWLATLMFFWTIYRHYLPSTILQAFEFCSSRISHKLVNYFSPYLDITFDEYAHHHFNRSEAYIAIQHYLSDKSYAKARKMNADYIQDGKSLLLKMGDDEEIMDHCNGVQVWWSFHKVDTKQPSYSFYQSSIEKRCYKLAFHAKHRKYILDTYLPYVLEEGESIAVRRRRRKLFTNAGDPGEDMWDNYIDFKHPARFEMLAMEKAKKQMILDDLQWFKSAKEYYARIGKPWKRGYLLYGPPGTGKSTLVAAMANLLDYDIYDLELTSVRNNKQLRRLLIETSCKSIILIEDIDCSLDLTGQREKKKAEGEEKDGKDPLKRKPVGDEAGKKKKGSEVTLSGLLNIIDGIWSACGEERIIVFTTNHVDKLDPALVRPGRMDLHIELSYCRYDAFKMLARNYLQLESHPLFEPIGTLLEEINVTPADVAENLMPRSLNNTTAEDCLRNLVAFLEKVKQEKKLISKGETMLEDGEKSAAWEEESEEETSDDNEPEKETEEETSDEDQ